MDAIEGKVVNRGDEDDGVFDLDVWLREAAEDAEDSAYSFSLGGRIYTLLSPDDFDWQQQSRGAADPNKGDLRPFVQMLLGEEQYEEFCTNSVPARGIEKIVSDWQDHHGITAPESRASRRASERTTKKPRPTSRKRSR
ncbi:hypothetical protein ACFRCG_41880 [Embleya sp. NPDC056575]|uniref:hypothetical protein n=1 Tax=unclassified Embleya TaxID=2699296 RepID=UPI00369CC175